MKKFLGLIFLGLIGLFFWMSYNEQKEIKIGFVAGLSGKYSSLGHSVLNGVLLALEEVDYKINNTKITLIQQDDKQNDQAALEAIEYFNDNGVDVIIGNTTSSMTKVSVEALKKYPHLFMISPTASSSKFSNIDDNFFRTQVAHNVRNFDNLSKHLIKEDKKRVYVVYDTNNRSYVENYINNFQESFLDNGGLEFIATKPLNYGYDKLLEDINANNIDAIAVVANSIDSSKFIQFLRINNLKQLVSVAAWAKSDDFIENGGSAVEGVLFSTGYDDNSKLPSYVKFYESYLKRFKNPPSLFSAQAYETTQIILKTLKNENQKSYKEKILAQKVFEGLQGKIIFNEYGDVHRDYFLMTVSNGKFLKIKNQ